MAEWLSQISVIFTTWRHPSLLQPDDDNDMAPHPGIHPDQIKDKARKDLLDLLESVCKAP